MEDSNVALQAVDSEGNLVDQTTADAMYLKDGSGNIIVNLEKMTELASISAVTHEVLHDITADQLAGLSEEKQGELIQSFQTRSYKLIFYHPCSKLQQHHVLYPL